MILTPDQWIKKLREQNSSSRRPYRAMYSSWVDGIITDPSLMLIPMDDHMVHRGDGVFEAMRIVNGAVYELDAHLERLSTSAAQIALQMPMDVPAIADRVVATAQAAGLREGMVRLFVSRGPGGFSPNPYDSVGAQLYIVITDFTPYKEEAYKTGVKVIRSQVSVKPSEWARVKSCNYLPNVLMKKEAVDAGVEFAIGITPNGYVAEGPTENIFMISRNQELCVPKFEYTLKGITLTRVMELAAEHVNSLTAVVERDLAWHDLEQANAVFMAGTTLEVLPVRMVGQVELPKPGEMALKLRKLLQADMGSHTGKRRPIFPS